MPPTLPLYVIFLKCIVIFRLALIISILNRSIKQVWNTETLKFYGSEAAKGTPLPQGYSNIKDDPHQMGGDFIVFKDFKLKFVYRSKTPSDRPSVDQVLEVLSHGRHFQG